MISGTPPTTGFADRAPWLWLAALAAGASYMLPVLADAPGGPLMWAWKGAGVGLLALWAAANARCRSGWVMAAVLALGALGDVLLDAAGLVAGGAAFAAGHVLAIFLYLWHRRPALTTSQRALALLLIPLGVVLAGTLTGPPGAVLGQLGRDMAIRGQSDILMMLIYTALVAGMAAAAWSSRFSRYRTGIGAILFLVSDLLIFARLGGTVDADAARMLIWPLYFAGQALIARGVVPVLAGESTL